MQEQQEPVPIHIRIDTQEQRSGIPDLLASMPQVHIEVIPLRMGDYDVGGDPCRIFERKTGSDFLCSLAQGRLFPQLAALLKSRFAPILLLEGDPLGVRGSQMRPRSASAGRSPTSPPSYACRSYPSLGPADSAHLVYAVAKRCQVGKVHGRVEHAAHSPPAGRRRGAQSEQQMHIMLSLPGIGPVTARAVCERFRSLHDLLNADAAQLAAVPGVGSSRAAALEQLLHVALPPSHAALTSKRGEDVQMQAPYSIKEQALK
jgi:ERCC4-type nuclease